MPPHSPSLIPRAPLHICSLTLSPHTSPVAAPDGTIFESSTLLQLIHRTHLHPLSGTTLHPSDVIPLNFSKNPHTNTYRCPIFFTALTPSTKILAIATTGNVYSEPAISRLNVSPHYMRDLIDGTPFTLKHIIVLYDPAVHVWSTTSPSPPPPSIRQLHPHQLLSNHFKSQSTKPLPPTISLRRRVAKPVIKTQSLHLTSYPRTYLFQPSDPSPPAVVTSASPPGPCPISTSHVPSASTFRPQVATDRLVERQNDRSTMLSSSMQEYPTFSDMPPPPPVTTPVSPSITRPTIASARRPSKPAFLAQVFEHRPAERHIERTTVVEAPIRRYPTLTRVNPSSPDLVASAPMSNPMIASVPRPSASPFHLQIAANRRTEHQHNHTAKVEQNVLRYPTLPEIPKKRRRGNGGYGGVLPRKKKATYEQQGSGDGGEGEPNKEGNRACHDKFYRKRLAEDERKIVYRKVRKGKKGKGYVRVVTNIGHLNVELHCDRVPITCDNFLTLAERGYYDGLTWHRVVPGFIAQTGDPTGVGDAGESAWGGFLKDEIRANLVHDAPGIVSMANSGRDTNRSQWFVCFEAARHLDGAHTVFGKVVGGMFVLKKMENEAEMGHPLTVERIEVLVNPFRQIREKLNKTPFMLSDPMRPNMAVAMSSELSHSSPVTDGVPTSNASARKCKVRKEVRRSVEYSAYEHMEMSSNPGSGSSSSVQGGMPRELPSAKSLMLSMQKKELSQGHSRTQIQRR